MVHQISDVTNGFADFDVIDNDFIRLAVKLRFKLPSHPREMTKHPFLTYSRFNEGRVRCCSRHDDVSVLDGLLSR